MEVIHEKDHPKAATIAKAIGVQATTFRKHYVPVLKSLGIRNDGDGYYDPDQRQT